MQLCPVSINRLATQVAVVVGLPLRDHNGACAPHIDEFCQDADANLLGRPSMKVEANWCVHPIQPLACNALGFEVLPDLGNPRLTAEHAQVTGWPIVDLFQDGMVVRMPPG